MANSKRMAPGGAYMPTSKVGQSVMGIKAGRRSALNPATAQVLGQALTADNGDVLGKQDVPGSSWPGPRGGSGYNTSDTFDTSGYEIGRDCNWVRTK